MKRFKGTKDSWYVVNYAGTYIVQDRHMYDDANILDSDDVGESKAYYNAKLISCAPLLLDALQDLVRFCEDNNVGAELEYAKEVINKSIEP